MMDALPAQETDPLRLAACVGKEPFSSRSAAQRALKRLTRKPHGRARFNVYRCAGCSAYHIGSTP